MIYHYLQYVNIPPLGLTSGEAMLLHKIMNKGLSLD